MIATVNYWGVMKEGLKGPNSYAFLGRPAALKIMQAGIEGFKTADDAGLIIGYGSDAGMINVFHGENAKGLIFGVKESGLTPVAVLKHATIDSAYIMGEHDRKGTVKAGKIADLIVVDGNPDQNIDCILGGVTMVIKAGQVVNNLV